MKRSILLGVGLCVLLWSNASAGRLVRDGRAYFKDINHSSRFASDGRIYLEHHRRGVNVDRYARRLWLGDNLVGDELAIYDEYGYTPHRLFYLGYGKRTERWKYYSLGLEFWFDENSNLIETRHFPPEDDHID